MKLLKRTPKTAFVSAFVSLCFVIVASGCATGGTESGSSNPAHSSGVSAPSTRVVPSTATGELPEELRRSLQVRDYGFKPGKRPTVSVRFFNASRNEEMVFHVRTIFYRADGSIVDATQWSDAAIRPRQSFQYRASSFSPWAKSEQVEIRLP